MTEAEARTRLERMVAHTTEPALSAEEITDLLNDSRRARVWAGETAYAYGDVVLPTVGNGRAYTCIVAGDSAETEPAWPTYDSGELLDGTALRWRESGSAPSALWDLTSAAYHGWLLKAAKAVEYDFQSAGQRFNRSQIIDQCHRMADRYLPVYIV